VVIASIVVITSIVVIASIVVSVVIGIDHTNTHAVTPSKRDEVLVAKHKHLAVLRTLIAIIRSVSRHRSRTEPPVIAHLE